MTIQAIQNSLLTMAVGQNAANPTDTSRATEAFIGLNVAWLWLAGLMMIFIGIAVFFAWLGKRQ